MVQEYEAQTAVGSACGNPGGPGGRPQQALDKHSMPRRPPPGGGGLGAVADQHAQRPSGDQRPHPHLSSQQAVRREKAALENVGPREALDE